MRTFALVSAILAAAVGCAAPAAAQNYPWCATYSMAMGDGRNCGFVSFEQCLTTVRGTGGFCEPNTQYAAPAGASGAQARRRTQH